MNNNIFPNENDAVIGNHGEDLQLNNKQEQLFTLKQCVEAVNFWSMSKIPEEIILKHLKGEIK